MTLQPDYQIPAGSLDFDQMKEQISVAYVHMVATAAGLTILDWKTDFGAVDLTLKSYCRYDWPGGFQPSIDMQLKATVQDLGSGADFGWKVNARTHEKLCDPYRATTALFAVLELPSTPELWLNHNTEGLLARSHMYWVRASSIPALKDGADSVTVRINKSDLFNPKSALELMEEASKRWA